MKQYKFWILCLVAWGICLSMSSSAMAQKLLSPGYRGFVEAGYSFGVGPQALNRIEISTTHGYQFNKYFFAGVGIGVNYYTLESTPHAGRALSKPVFAELRGDWSGSRISPFVAVKVGYTLRGVHRVEGFYFAPAVGLRYATSQGNGWNLSLGYTVQEDKRDCPYRVLSASEVGQYEEMCLRKWKNLGAITVKLGFDF